MRRHVNTDKAPAAIGTYSQAVFAGDTLYLSGQLGLDPATMTLPAEFAAQCERMFSNLKAVVEAAGASLDQVVKLTVFLTDLSYFATVNEVMARYFTAPYPARSAVEVKGLPRGAMVEAEAVVWLGA